MKLPNNGEDGAPVGHLPSPHKASSARNGLHINELLAKEAPLEPLHNLGQHKLIDFSPLKTTLTQ